MKNKTSIIVGGSGQFGITLSKLLLKKKHLVIITTRNVKKAKKKIKILNKKLKIVKLDILKLKQIKRILIKYNPDYIFYFASQSSPGLSYKMKKQTYESNFIGCKNFLEIIKTKNLNCKFLNACSSEIFAKTNQKLNINSKKNPISPYGKSKLLSFDITKKYRNDYLVNAYNAIIFNTESIYRDKKFLVPKICLSAINAHKFNSKCEFGNINVSREWNWCEEQVGYLFKFIIKKPQDFLLSNQKLYSAKDMLNFAFSYFNLNYKSYIVFNRKHLRPDDFKIKKSNAKNNFLSNKIKHKYNIYGKKMINSLIKFYLYGKKYKL